MHKLFTSSYDASIYLQQPDQNTGRDEILEVGKLYYGSTMDIARTLIKFPITDVSQSIASNVGTGSYKVFLNLKAANSEEIPVEYTIYANAVSSSWVMGTGTKFDNTTYDGVTWKYRNGLTATKWVDYDTTGGTAVYPTTGNRTTGSNNAEGAVWYLSGSASQSFNYESDDVRMDVTDIVKLWISGTIDNNGFIIHHHESASVNDGVDYGVIKFFSKETHTIYEPTLEVVWDDSSFAPTGSITAMPVDNFKVTIANLKSKYNSNTKTKIKVRGRELFPIKDFADSFNYSDIKYLPQESYYQLEDYLTEEIIFPFGNYTKLSCDSNGSYFVLDLQSLPIDRIYKLKLKVVIDNIDYIFDEKYTFQIV
jgi:hypothetical protein